MRILIELPTWLGDSVMATPAVENIVKTYPDAKLTLFGSFVSISTLKNHPNVEKIVLDNSKSAKFRFIRLFKIVKSLGEFDLTLSFRRVFFSKLFLFFSSSKRKFRYKRYSKKQIHQVKRYNDFINKSLDVNLDAHELKLYHKPKKFKKPTLGINPGATYGSAKQWFPKRFAKVAKSLSSLYDIIIFGSESEKDIADDIEKILIDEGIKNISNLAGKTTIQELCENIGGLSMFITADSGPMHIASAYKIPTICLFGPTKHIETSQWENRHSKIIRHELKCSPCMKRECPLKTNECMELILVDEVLKEEKNLRNAIMAKKI